MIKLVRIDYRLLHGQVVFSWTKSQGINRIIVINNEAATDEFKKMSLNLAKPTEGGNTEGKHHADFWKH